MCVYHFQILGMRCYRKRQPRQGEAPRDIQTVDDPTVEPTTKGVSVQSNQSGKRFFRIVRKRDIPVVLPKTRRIRCKTMSSLLSEGSPKLLALTQSSGVWNLYALFAEVREKYAGFPKVGR